MYDILFKDIKSMGYSKVFIVGKNCHYLMSDSKQEIKKFSKNRGMLILETNSYDARRYSAQKALVDGIMSCEKHGKMDRINYPDSGMDDVLAKEMAKNNVALIINARDFIEAEDRAKILERMMFNIKLAKKFKTPIMVISGAKKEIQLKHPS
ncbi:MAG: hypothetical protein DRP29_08930, partial [Thermodesulfobacteriota bacterium]